MGSSFSIYCFAVLLWILCNAIISKFVKKKIYVLPVATYSYNLPRRLFKRPSIPKHIRREVFSRAGYKCVYCGSQYRLEIDHVLPWSKGGAHNISNFVCACRKCNRQKSDKILF